MWFLVVACVGSAFLVSLAATAIVRRFAPAWGLVAIPNHRTIHQNPTPVGGGIGIWLGVVIPLVAAAVLARLLATGTIPADWLPETLSKHLAGVQASSGRLFVVLGAATLIAALGLIDDIKALPWQPKLAVQFLVAMALVAGGVQATVFAAVPWIGWIITVVWIVTLTNAFNFLDNMDGLSGGLAMIAAMMFACIMLTGTSQPRWFVAGSLLIVAGSTAGFLVHNWPPAKIFMGDTGSCMLGTLLASFTVVGTFYEYHTSRPYVVLAPLCVLAVPFYDFITVIWIRLRQGRSPFHADKCHFSHRLVELGLSRKHAVMTIHLLAITTGLAGLLLYQVRDITGAILVAAIVACSLAVIGILETAGRRALKRAAPP